MTTYVGLLRAINLGAPRPVHDLNTLKVDAEGRYDVILSPTRPAGYTGDWWQLNPTTNAAVPGVVLRKSSELI